MKKNLCLNVPIPFGSDPSLEPFAPQIAARHQRTERVLQKLTENKITIEDFASGHEYFGLHRTRGKWIFREMSMVALDKYEKRLSVDVRVFVKYEKRANAAGISVAAAMNAVLDDAVATDPWTREDEERARALIDANFAKRETKKAKKGIK